MARPSSARRNAQLSSRFVEQEGTNDYRDKGETQRLGTVSPLKIPTARSKQLDTERKGDDGLGSERDDLETDEEYATETESAGSLRRMMAPQVLHETTNNFHVRTIRKWETDGFRMVKKLLLRYMEEGRAELKEATQYW